MKLQLVYVLTHSFYQNVMRLHSDHQASKYLVGT